MPGLLYFHCWSGGKDSTCSIILDHELGLPPSTIVMSEVMFDKINGISGERPEHMEWVHTKAKPLFESWGYKVEIIHAQKDFLDCFFHRVEKSSYPERIGKCAGFPLGHNRCTIKRDLKIRAIEKYYRQFSGQEITQYISIAQDEYGRLESLKGANQVSLLLDHGYTEQMARAKCLEYDLLSPSYSIANRGGCWFCMNQGMAELAPKQYRPDLWEKLKALAGADDLISPYFKYNKTFDQIDAAVDEWIERQRNAGIQLSLFDMPNNPQTPTEVIQGWDTNESDHFANAGMS